MRVLLFLLGLMLALPEARAEGFDLPGAAADAAQYQQALSRRFPAGSTPQQRAAAEARAAQAERQQNWTAAAEAWEARLGGGDPKPEQWLALARAQLQKVPPDAARALQAAWQNFQSAPAGLGEVPGLLLMAEALLRLDRPAQQIQALEAAAERAPDNVPLRQALADARRAAGLLVARRPHRAPRPSRRAPASASRCAPVRRADFACRRTGCALEPAVAGRGGDARGRPASASPACRRGARDAADAARRPAGRGRTFAAARTPCCAVAMPNRQPRIAFDTRLFVLPRGQAPAVGAQPRSTSRRWR